MKYWFAFSVLVGFAVWYITYNDAKKKFRLPNDTFGPVGSVLK